MRRAARAEARDADRAGGKGGSHGLRHSHGADHIAATPQEVEQIACAAARSGADVAIKILSEDISHKSDVGGVVSVSRGGRSARRRRGDDRPRAQARPERRIEGFTVQPMIARPGAHELIAGVSERSTFGPAILFGGGRDCGRGDQGHGGRAAAARPRAGARSDARTRVYRLLQGYRDGPQQTRRHRRDAGPALAARRRSSRVPRARHQSAARRREA